MEISLLTPYWKNSYGGGVKIYSVQLVDNFKKYHNINIDVLFREGLDKKQHFMGYNKIVYFIYSTFFLIKKGKNNTIISLNTWYCILPALISKIIYYNKVIFIPLSEIDKITLLQRIFFKFLLMKVNTIVINTSISKKHYEKKLNTNLLNSVIIPIAAYIEPVNSNEITQFKQKYNLNNKKIILIQGFLSNKIKADGVILILNLIEKISTKYDIKLILTGYGPYSEYISKYVNEHNLKEIVIMTGLLSKPSIPLQVCDIFLFPWLGEDEGGLAIIEAMLIGKPIVYARNSYSEIIQNNFTGLITDISEKNILNAIELLFTHPSLSKILGENAKKISEEKYTWKIYIEKISSLI